MTLSNFALYFTCLLMANMVFSVHQTKQSALHFKSTTVGASVTLECLCQDKGPVMFYWYKQTLGLRPKLVSTYYKHNSNGTFHDDFKDDPRFSLDTKNLTSHLKISHLQFSDSATYYCLGSNLYDFTFCEAITIHIKGSGVTVPALVQQSPSESIQPGGSVTLNCTVHTGSCHEEHTVYWFKHSEESHPGLIYTHGDRNDQCERKANTQTHTCVYNLPMESLNLSHAGTYYCAVASCGHILFGNGTKLGTEYPVDSPVLVYFLSGALASSTILVILLACTVYKMSQRKCQCPESAKTSTTNTAPCQDADSLHYAALRASRASRPRPHTDETWSECVYSRVKL